MSILQSPLSNVRMLVGVIVIWGLAWGWGACFLLCLLARPQLLATWASQRIA